ncbi:serine/threonine-protein kinase [uncultured Roseobacter sp.]|uniref:serine/threonine-protein kinase n=1 Tax=uncultured Roseobacter sp. TaxID=114847 RepID=UPI002622318A|nr:serine/threonine-protein kinase [uncultured Roseobacter sp.]
MTDRTIIAPMRLRIGKYLLGDRLGEGAMGVVFEAHDRDIDRTVAIKTIHRHLIDTAEGADWLARFAREARAAGRVIHPNLVTIFDYLEEEGRPYLVMERLQAETLDARLGAQTLTLDEVAGITAQMLDGLAAIHTAGIVHRDMKPANIMLTPSGTVKLTDFGIARFTRMEHTGAGMIGTPAYMAPEQFSGDTVDSRTDLYAAGVILYEVLTGQQPYRGGGVAAVMLAAKGQSVPPPSACVPALPAALDAVVMRAIRPEPAERFQSAEEMKAALIAAIGTAGAARTKARPSDQPPSARTMIARLSLRTLRDLEDSVIRQIGPIGKLITRRAAETALTQEDLLSQLMGEITDPDQREILRCRISGLLSTDPGRATEGLSDADLGAVIAALTPHLGPIAGTLVRRQSKHSTSLAHLLDTIAAEVADDRARAAFLDTVQSQTAEGNRHA